MISCGETEIVGSSLLIIGPILPYIVLFIFDYSQNRSLVRLDDTDWQCCGDTLFKSLLCFSWVILVEYSSVGSGLKLLISPKMCDGDLMSMIGKNDVSLLSVLLTSFFSLFFFSL